MKNTRFIEEHSDLIQNKLFTQGSKKKQESDQQMLTGVAIKFAVLFFVIFMFDSLLDWLMGIIDLIFELIHLGMDAIEYSIELILEHMIHAGHQESEIIIVNGALLIAFYIMYRTFLAMPRMSLRFTRRCKATWLLRKRRKVACWRAMSLASKIKLISAYALGTSCLLFLVTL